MGMNVNYAISGFYFLLFTLVILTQAVDSSHSQDQISIGVYFIKNWFKVSSPYPPIKS